MTLCRRGVVTGKIRRLSSIITSHPEAGLIVSIQGFNKVDISFQTAALRSCMVSGVLYSEICAPVYEWWVQLVLYAQRRWKDWIHHLCSILSCRRVMFTWWRQSTVVLKCHNLGLSFSVFRLLDTSCDNFSPLFSFVCGGFPLSALQIR